MNVYDFDGTIYRGDSSLDFYLFCLRKHPALIRFLPMQAFGVAAYKLRAINKTRGKEFFFSFLRGVEDVEESVRLFWKEHIHRIEKWYLSQKEPTDVIISASPEFLLSPICRTLNISLIASCVDSRNGKFNGRNCFGEEKKRRFLQDFGKEATIYSFYSDSYSDTPLAELSTKCYLTNKGTIKVWKSENAQ